MILDELEAAYMVAEKEALRTRNALLKAKGVDIWFITPGPDTDCKEQREAVAARKEAVRLARLF